MISPWMQDEQSLDCKWKKEHFLCAGIVRDPYELLGEQLLTDSCDLGSEQGFKKTQKSKTPNFLKNPQVQPTNVFKNPQVQTSKM